MPVGLSLTLALALILVPLPRHPPSSGEVGLAQVVIVSDEGWFSARGCAMTRDPRWHLILFLLLDAQLDISWLCVTATYHRAGVVRLADHQ